MEPIIDNKYNSKLVAFEKYICKREIINCECNLCFVKKDNYNYLYYIDKEEYYLILEKCFCQGFYTPKNKNIPYIKNTKAFSLFCEKIYPELDKYWWKLVEQSQEKNPFQIRKVCDIYPEEKENKKCCVLL